MASQTAACDEPIKPTRYINMEPQLEIPDVCGHGLFQSLKPDDWLMHARAQSRRSVSTTRPRTREHDTAGKAVSNAERREGAGRALKGGERLPTHTLTLTLGGQASSAERPRSPESPGWGRPGTTSGHLPRGTSKRYSDLVDEQLSLDMVSSMVSSPLSASASSPVFFGRGAAGAARPTRGGGGQRRKVATRLREQSYTPDATLAGDQDDNASYMSWGWPAEAKRYMDPADGSGGVPVFRVTIEAAKSQSRTAPPGGGDATSRKPSNPLEPSGEPPCVPCVTKDCPHEAALWSPVDKRPYCPICWSIEASRPETRPTTPSKVSPDLSSSLQNDAGDAPRPKSPFERPVSPKRLYLGRSYLADSSFSQYADSIFRMRQMGQGLVAVPRRRPFGKRRVLPTNRAVYAPSPSPYKIVLGGPHPDPPAQAFQAQGTQAKMSVPIARTPPVDVAPAAARRRSPGPA